jgi:hypothetical protein
MNPFRLDPPTSGAPTFRRGLRHSLAAGLLAIALPVGAQQAPAPAPAAAADKAEINPKAIAALKEMGAHLRTLKSFTIVADTTVDEVLTTGQKIQFPGTLTYRVLMPNRLKAELRNELKHRDFFFDGKSFTQFAPRLKYYASVPAPGTIAELLQAADAKLGVQIPLADLFLWGTDRSGIEDITAAAYVGPGRIGGVDCDHYAFRQTGVDWQVWIAQGKRPLPCRLIVTTTEEPSQPQYAATLKWDTTTAVPASTFTFTPPAGAKRIDIAAQAAAK